MAEYGGIGGLKAGRGINTDDLFEVALNECFGDLMRSNKAACEEVWAALANAGWRHMNGDEASYSFRAAGDLIAAIRGEGNYMDWYCCGPQNFVSERLEKAMLSKGWKHDPQYYNKTDN